MKDIITSSVTTTRTITLNDDDIIGLLRRLDPTIGHGHGEVTLTTPRGDNINVDDDHPITVTFFTVQEK